MALNWQNLQMGQAPMTYVPVERNVEEAGAPFRALAGVANTVGRAAENIGETKYELGDIATREYAAQQQKQAIDAIHEYIAKNPNDPTGWQKAADDATGKLNETVGNYAVAHGGSPRATDLLQKGLSASIGEIKSGVRVQALDYLHQENVNTLMQGANAR